MMSAILDELTNLYEDKDEAINRWLAARRAEAAPYIYSSIDLRHSGSRLVPVDTNLFPAGFNNLSPAAGQRAIIALRDYMAAHAPAARRVLLIAESHTRNLAYLDNIVRLRGLFERAGCEVELASFAVASGAPLLLQSLSGATITQQPLLRVGNQLRCENGFLPDVVVLNNDLSAGLPDILDGIVQPVFPPPALGWYRRRKSVHFTAYEKLTEEFAREFGFDNWLISAFFHQCGMIDFRAREGLDCLAKGVDCVIERARRKHVQYGIRDAPYVFVKADSGTYGMGIMTARSGAEMLELNKKDRNKMQVIKEGAVNSEVIIQEGIPSIDVVEGAPAEPLIYLVDGIPVGGMYRVNENRDALSNLNAAGMRITGICDEAEESQDKVSIRGCHFQAYGLVAALAALAAPREDYAQLPNVKKLCAET